MLLMALVTPQRDALGPMPYAICHYDKRDTKRSVRDSAIRGKEGPTWRG